MLDREALEVGVGAAFVVAVEFNRVIARTHADSAGVEAHRRRIEDLPQKFLPGRGRKFVQQVTGRVGERHAEAKNLLKSGAGFKSRAGNEVARWVCHDSSGSVANRRSRSVT